MAAHRTVSVVTLGCARNEVDAEELAARLEDAGWTLVDDGDEAEVIVVNTCGFIEAAKQESVDTLLAAADSGAKVVATGCLAERYGRELAAALPEAAAVLSFDDYPEIGRRLTEVIAGRPPRPHVPRDRRALLPLAPRERPGSPQPSIPGHALPAPPGSAARVWRRRLDDGPVAPLKIASGCDRRCAFCAIPTFRGAYVSRRPPEVLAEARWLAGQGVRELFLVSENSTSYGKDLGDIRLLERLLPELAQIAGIARVRVSYLQPAELRPSLIEVIATTPGVAPYFDVSFQHASAPLLRRMRRFGDWERFLALIAQIRRHAPQAGIRSSFIVGFPGETETDLSELAAFLSQARLDAIGVFGYSDEDGTPAAELPDKLPAEEIARRVGHISGVAEELMSQRAEERIGETVEVLIEEEGEPAEGRAAHQAPEVDGTTFVHGAAGRRRGELVHARVTAGIGVDLVAETAPPRPGAAGTR